MRDDGTSRGLCGLVCPSRTCERGGKGDCVKEGGGEEGERVKEHAPGRNQTQNSRVAGARPNHQPIGDLEPNLQTRRGRLRLDLRRIILPPETGEQPLVSSGWIDASWLNWQLVPS
jgi:hypothetical protein